MMRNFALICTMSFFLLVSCKSVYEKQGDEHLNAGRPFKALQRYKYVSKKNNGTKNFTANLTKAYIMAMQQTADEDADVEKLLTFREKINELLKETAGQEVSDLYTSTAVPIAARLIKKEDFQYDDVAFKLISDVEALTNIKPEITIQINSLKNDFIKKHSDKAQEHYQACMNGEATEGIIADYILSKLALFVTPNETVKTLWSKIRQANLSTYLMYDLQNLIDRPLPQINRFGVLLAVRVFSRTGNDVTIQAQAYNGSTANFKFVVEGFALVDTEGNEYKASKKRGAFSDQKTIEPGQETNVGEMGFTVLKDVEISHLRFQYEGGESWKYLP